MRGTLPSWLADWLGVERPTGGDAATWQLDVAWPWPPWATVLLVLGAVVWVVYIYRHEVSTASRAVRTLLAALRLIALAALLVMLTQAVIVLQQTGPPSIGLVIDRSASMGIADRYDDSPSGTSPKKRLELATSIATDNDARLLRRMLSDYRPTVLTVAERAEALPTENIETLVAAIRELSAEGQGTQATRLGDAIRQALADSRGATPAAVVLLTDGNVTAGMPLAEAARLARERGVPLYAVGLGSDRQPRNIAVTDVLVDDVVFLDDLVSFNVQIESTGLAGESAQVSLIEEGNVTPLAEQSITLGRDGEPQTVYLTHRPTIPGDIAYHVEVAPRDDETDRDDNRQRRIVSVRDEKIRVLLAFGYPSYEFRFLKTLLERDSTIDLATYLQDADPDYAEQDRTALRSFPISRDELLGFDVVILGDVDPQRLPRSVWPELQASVAEKGGGLVFVAGPRWLPWAYRDLAEAAALMPIDLHAASLAGDAPLPETVTRGFVVEPTPLGLRLPPLQLGDTPAESERIWQNLPPMYWLAPIDDLAPAAQVLAEHPTLTMPSGRRLPGIVAQYVGAGRVVFHAIDSTWRWRLRAGDVYFARYWVQTIRYLARGRLTGGRGAALTTDRREYRRGESVEVRLRFLDSRLAPADEEVSILVESPGKPDRRATLRRNAVAPSVFEGRLTDLGEGEYELMTVDSPDAERVLRARFAVVSPAGELARTAMNRASLTAAAETTHGKFYTIADASRLVDELPRGLRVPIANLPPVPLWNRWWLLALFLGAIITEWILRKRQGML